MRRNRLRAVAITALVTSMWVTGTSLVEAAPAAPTAAAPAPVTSTGRPVKQVRSAATPKVATALPQGRAAATAAVVPVRPERVRVQVPTGATERVPGAPVGVGPATGANGSAVAAPLDVQVLDEATAAKAGATAAVRIEAPAGSAVRTTRVSVDIAAAGAYGGGYAGRLRLLRVPDCPAGTPAADCLPVPLATTRDVTTLSAAVAVPADAGVTVVAAAAAAGDSGDFHATTLSSAGTWDVGQSSGSFTYSYPVPTAPSVGGDAPSLGLSYDSGGVDGRTTVSNGQSSWLGQGWDLSTGFVERSYNACADDGQPAAGAESCYGGLRYFLSLNGQSSELIPVGDAQTATQFRLRDDPGWRVQRLVGSPNGDDNGEYFTVESPDGTNYAFGYGRTPWATAGATNSVFTRPVLGDDAGEPCHAATLAGSFCTQGWRWNLDRIVDGDGNAQSFQYAQETNHYRSFDGTDRLYVRGGEPARLEYGGRAVGSAGATAAQTSPTARVDFVTSGRCTAALADGAVACPDPAANPAAYPDVPADLLCTTGCTETSPTYFTTRRLWRTESARLVGTTWRPLDRLTFAARMLDADGAGTVESPDLWLDSITRTGLAATPNVSLPAVRFAPVVKDNRADVGAGVSHLQKYRVGVVTSEFGGRTTVTYGHAPGHECTLAQFQGGTYTADDNVKECYPRWWTPPGGGAGFAWFHKYVVLRVAVEDPVTGAVLNPPAGTAPPSEPQVTDYEYVGTAAWHHDDEIGAAQTVHQSWAEWRGYGTVVKHTRAVTAGVIGAGDRTSTKTVFFRGMDGDATAHPGTKAVTVATVEAPPAADSNWLRGRPAEQTTYDDAGVEQQRQWHRYVARRTVDIPETADTTTRDAYRVQEAEVRTRRTAGGVVGAVRTASTTTYRTEADPLALLDGVADTVTDRGNEADPADDRCTRSIYTSNTARWVLTVGGTRSYTGACDTGAQVGRTDQFFDGQTVSGQAESPQLAGLHPTRTVDYTSPTASVTTASTYDAYGRALDAVDGRGARSRTVFTPANGVAVTTTATAPKADGTTGAGGAPSGFVTTTTADPATGLPVRSVDANGGATTFGYDALQRSATVRLPSDQASATDSMVFSYAVSDTVPSRVRTRTLQNGGDYADAYSYVDGLAREIEAQGQAPTDLTGARILQTTRYDDRGFVAASAGPLAAAGAAGSGWVNVAPASAPSETRTRYDWNADPVAEQQYSLGALTWQTTYDRDAAGWTVHPTTGGAVRYTVDPLGRTTAVTEQTAAGRTYATTRLAYYPDGQLRTVTTPLGGVSTYTYDWLRRTLTSADPDSGTSSQTYDADGNVATSTDGRGVTLTTTYDTLNRPVRRARGTTTLSTWAYDTLPNGKGLPTSQTAKVVPPGQLLQQDYTTSVTGYDTAGRPIGKSWSIPSGYGILLGQKYSESYGYDAAGHLTSVAYPAIGGLPAETVTAGWNALGLPQTLSSSKDGTLVDGTSFDALGRLTGRTYGAGGGLSPQTSRTYGYDDLNRLASVRTAVGASTKQNDTYAYASTDLSRVTDTLTGQRQCYRYDDVRRLSHAWTTDVDCADAAAPNHLAGPDPYDQTWTFDTDNDLLSVKNATIGGRTQTYTGQAVTGSPRHAATQVSDGRLPTDVSTLTYDAAGQLTRSSKPLAKPEDIVWDDQQRLVSDGEALTPTRFAYAADGTRLIRQTPKVTTLTLGNTEIDYAAGGLLSEGRRYYTLNGVRVAERRCPVAGLSTRTWLAADSQASTDVAVDATTGIFTRTRYTPYGQPRQLLNGSTGTGLPTDKGWLGATYDASTGLNELGARYFDGGLQQFTAPDPVMDPTDPRSLNPYTYASGNPIAFSDPSGLYVPKDAGDSGVPPGPLSAEQARALNASAAADAAEITAAAATSDSASGLDRGKELLKEGLLLAADVTGLKSIYDCVTKGDLGGCADAAFTALTSLVGAGVFKLFGRLITHLGDAKRAFNVVRDGLRIFQDARRLSRDAKELSATARSLRAEADVAEAAAARAAEREAAAAAEARAAASRSAGKAAAESSAGDPPTRIYSARVLERMADEPGPYHNFPGTFDSVIFDNGVRSETVGYFNKPKELLSNDSVQYRLSGSTNGRQGTYEIFTRPSNTGRTEVIIHRFFRPARQ